MAPTLPATYAQTEALLDFLAEHPQLARGLLRGSEGRIRAKRLWSDISTKLNAMGGCIKTVEQWQRVWSDKKFTAKRNAAAGRRAASATGGGPSLAPVLTAADEKILAVMGERFGEPQTSARVATFRLSCSPPPAPALPSAPAPPAAPAPTAAPAAPPSSDGRRRRRRKEHSVRGHLFEVEEERNNHLRNITFELSGIRNALNDLIRFLTNDDTEGFMLDTI